MKVGRATPRNRGHCGPGPRRQIFETLLERGLPPLAVTSLAGVLLALVAACASRGGEPGEGAPSTPSAQVEATWGLRVERISLTAAGGLVEVRYRVTNPEKAGRGLGGSLWSNHGVIEPEHVQHAPLLIDED